jgi:cytochrome P450
MAKPGGLAAIPGRGARSPAAMAGPSGRASAAIFASVARSPLDGYITVFTRYGDTVRVPMGPLHPRFLLSRPEYAEHVLVTHQDNYVKSFTIRGIRALIGDGLLTSEGETWRRHRRIVQPAFSRREVATFGPAIVDAARRMLSTWARLPDGARLDVAAQLSALTLDIVGHALFGTDLTGDAEQMRRNLAAGQRVALAAGLLSMPWGPRSARAIKATATLLGHTPEGIDGLVQRLIAQRREELGSPASAAAEPGRAAAEPGRAAAEQGSAAAEPGSASPGPSTGRRRDLLDILMTARAEDGTALTDEEVAAELATFLLAGHETSANALSWTLALLSAFPAARARLEEEVDWVLGGREPEAADVARLPWTASVISEAMRLYPPAWTIERNAVVDDNVAGVDVPAGSLVTISPYLIHRHPEFWPDPAGFDPARFLPADHVNQAAVTRPSGAERPRYAYIPFGGGRRACVGQSFAELETALVLAAITQRYRLELTALGVPKPVANITLRPGRGLPMRLTRR